MWPTAGCLHAINKESAIKKTAVTNLLIGKVKLVNNNRVYMII